MTITINLENSDYCNGCPLLHLSTVYPLSMTYCKYYTQGSTEKGQLKMSGSQLGGWEAHRPDKCKEENGL